jgi:probable phosphoglycerate mutase
MPAAEVGPLYLIRHGQTRWNLAGRLQGSQDSPLTEAGIAQAAALATALAPAPPLRLLASPLGRARRTAALLAARLGLPAASVEPALAELRFGAAEGLTRAEIEARWPGLFAARERDRWQFRWPGGESYALLDRRLAGFIDGRLRALLAAPAGPLAIVAHETVNMVLLGRLLGLAPEVVAPARQPNDVLYRVAGIRLEHRRLEPPAAPWQPGLVVPPPRAAAG